MGNKPYWELNPVQKLQDIAMKADSRTKTKLFNWIKNYVEVFSGSYMIDHKHLEFSNADYRRHCKEHKLTQLGKMIADMTSTEDLVKHENRCEEHRFTAFAILPKKKKEKDGVSS